MSDITYQRNDYQHALDQWQLVEDACAGEAEVKGAGEAYLPKPNPLDLSQENIYRYHAYKQRAVYYNAAGKTLSALVGMAFRQDPDVTLPAELNYLIDDVDGGGLKLIQQAQAALDQVMKTGRCGLLVDYPAVEEPASKAAMADGAIAATVSQYDAKDIINWRTTKIGGKHVLSLVVLSEMYEEADGFGSTFVRQYRELALQDGAYIVRVWRQNDQRDWAVFEEYSPKNGNGAPWSTIPFIFVGSTNNDPSIDLMPMYDLASLNIAHYRNSADFEDSAFLIGQPTFWMSGVDDQWQEDARKHGVYIGSRTIVGLPTNGHAGILQAAPNNLILEAMKAKEAQMLALGARLVQPQRMMRTATQVNSEDLSAHSVLSIACGNVSAAYDVVLHWCADFMRAAGKIGFQIDTEFVTDKMDAQALTAIVGAVQAGLLPNVDAWEKFREWGLIDPAKDDEQIRGEVEVATTGLALGPPTKPEPKPGKPAQ